MAMRSVICGGGGGAVRSRIMNIRYFGDGKVLGEEERAAENVYIKKMERERLEKAKLKAEKEKAEKEKADKKAEEATKS